MSKSFLTRIVAPAVAGATLMLTAAALTPTMAQDPPSWRQPEPYVTAPPPEYGKSAGGGNGYLGSQTAPRRGGPADDAYRPPPPAATYQPPPASTNAPPYAPPYARPGDRAAGSGDTYVLPPRQPSAAANDAYRPDGPSGPPSGRGYADSQREGYGERYSPPPASYSGNRRDDQRFDERGERRTFSQNEILGTGHRFFGSVSKGLARAVEYVFQQSGRPNGYILGEDAGGAFIAGLRYGEGTLYTKDAGNHRVYWQGPSLGYDFGGEGSKTMVLVYHLRDPSDIYHRFGGIQGSAYLIGGVSVQFQKHGDVVLAPIRSGVGLRLGANVGYLKYTRKPTWNPF